MGSGDEDVLRGKIDQAKGRVKKAIGELTDDPERKAEGTLDKAKGLVNELKGKAKNRMDRELDDAAKGPDRSGT
jgi:uncharacterized protein YjbJ (UPF0337 family)